MDCKKAHNNFIFYLDNELNYPEQKDLEEHLKHCTSCQKLFDDIQSTYSQTDAPKISENFTQKVMDYTFNRYAQTKSVKQFIKFARNLAAVILFMLVSLSTLIVVSETNKRQYAKSNNSSETEFINYYFSDLEVYNLESYYNVTKEDQ
ncbi:MAG: zf-HC2 domain-containing protein [Bacteroidales bacterium]|nr:zf-HC2 domain-containing protein [Bacteroidales bacterium]